MKKFMALLATGLVMALSATTVFAAGSVSLDTVKAVDEDTVKANVYVAEDLAINPELTEVKVDDKSAEVKADSTAAKEALAQFEANNKVELKGAAVAAYADIVVKLYDADGKEVAVSEENPAYISVAAIAADAVGKNPIVLNYQNNKWVEVELVEIDGTTFAKFTHFSPVMVLTYTEKIEEPDPVPPTPPVDDDDDETVSTVATSPKTGVLPVAAFAATICLAGAAVCGRKVK